MEKGDIYMINDKLILELFSRVVELEGKVEHLESIINSNNITEDEIEEIEKAENKITRSNSRQYVIDKLKEFNPELIIEKGNRAMGNGIVITDKNNTYLKNCKFYHSKGFHDDFSAGWHTVNEQDLNDTNIHYFIFNVEYKGQFSTYIFTRDELKEFTKDKVKDQSNNYHFYFQIKNDKVLECRDGERDASKYLNRWDVIK